MLYVYKRYKTVNGSNWKILYTDCQDARDNMYVRFTKSFDKRMTFVIFIVKCIFLTPFNLHYLYLYASKLTVPRYEGCQLLLNSHVCLILIKK